MVSHHNEVLEAQEGKGNSDGEQEGRRGGHRGPASKLGGFGKRPISMMVSRSYVASGYGGGLTQHRVDFPKPWPKHLPYRPVGVSRRVRSESRVLR